MKFYFISGTIHLCLLLGVLFFQLNSVKAPSVLNDEPMQLTLLPSVTKIVATAQPLKKKSSPKKAKRKTPTSKKLKVSTSSKGTLKANLQREKRVKPQQTGGEGETTLKASYAQALFLYFSRNKFYPRKARKMNHSGTVAVKIHVTAEGVFQHIHLEKECDHDTLNQAAMHLIQKLGKFEPLPKSMGSGEDFTVPIEYQVSRGSL